MNKVGIVKIVLGDHLFSVRRLSECSMEYFKQKFTESELDEVERIRTIELKRGNSMLYPLTRYMLAHVLFEVGHLSIVLCAFVIDLTFCCMQLFLHNVYDIVVSMTLSYTWHTNFSFSNSCGFYRVT